jgi:hypothetical protein
MPLLVRINELKPEVPMSDVKTRIQEAVVRVRSKMKVTKVVATRAVKTKRGDFFAGMSAAWDTVQDDAGGPGADMDLTVTTDETAGSGMSIEDARVAHVLLGMECSIAAWRAALTEGAINKSEFDNRVKAIKHNTASHLEELTRSAPNSSEENAA